MACRRKKNLKRINKTTTTIKCKISNLKFIKIVFNHNHNNNNNCIMILYLFVSFSIVVIVIIIVIIVIMYVCVCVCLCVCEYRIDILGKKGKKRQSFIHTFFDCVYTYCSYIYIDSHY